MSQDGGVERTPSSILGAADRYIEAAGWPVLLGICAVALFLSSVLALNRPLTHDEIYTFWVARQTSLAGVYSALLAHADNHPPIDYWVRHLSMEAIGASELGLRLPSLMAFAGAMLACFMLVRRHWGAVCGIVAVCVLLASQASSMSYFGRSYALVLLWTASGLFFWRMAVDHSYRTVALICLGILFATAVDLHFYAPFHLLAIVAAEAVRTVQRRKVDWPMLAAFMCGAAGLPLVLPLLPYARSFSKSFWKPVSLDAAFQSYGDLFFLGLPGFVATLALWAAFRASSSEHFRSSKPTLPNSRELLPEIAAGMYLLALPFVIYAVAKSGSGAFLAKYCISAVLGVAILMAYAGSQSLFFRWAALVAMLGMGLLALGAKAAVAIRSGHSDVQDPMIGEILSRSELPVVFEAPQVFLELGQYATPAVRSRLFFLEDLDSAIRYGSETTDQIAMPGLARVSPFQIIDRSEFYKQHPHFIVLYNGGWLSRKLADDHAKMTFQYFGRTPVMEVDLRTDGADSAGVR